MSMKLNNVEINQVENIFFRRIVSIDAIVFRFRLFYYLKNCQLE